MLKHVYRRALVAYICPTQSHRTLETRVCPRFFVTRACATNREEWRWVGAFSRVRSFVTAQTCTYMCLLYTMSRHYSVSVIRNVVQTRWCHTSSLGRSATLPLVNRSMIFFLKLQAWGVGSCGLQLAGVWFEHTRPRSTHNPRR